VIFRVLHPSPVSFLNIRNYLQYAVQGREVNVHLTGQWQAAASDVFMPGTRAHWPTVVTLVLAPFQFYATLLIFSIIRVFC
jgi:hypothetical protein